MKKLYLLLLTMLCYVASAYAQSFEVDGISYSITKSPVGELPGEVEVTGGEVREVIEIPETVTYNDVSYTVTSIGNNAFSGRSNSSNFTRKYIIPGTVKTIGNNAFYDNYYLEEVEFNEGLETIGAAAFAFNFALKEIRLPSTLLSIDDSGFYTDDSNIPVYCTAATPPNIHANSFHGRTTGSLHVTTADVEAYKEAEFWKDFSEIIGDIVFRKRCYSPVVTNDNNLVTMTCKTEEATIYYTTDGSTPNENAIRYTSPIPYTTDQIILAIAIAEGYENSFIRNFYDREHFEQIEHFTDEQGVLYTLRIADEVYYAVSGHSNELKTEIVIPANHGIYPVRTIEDNAFANCTSLVSITFPNSMTRIGGGAFGICRNLTTVKLGKNVRSIGGGAFSHCSNLTSIVLPNRLESIGEQAFRESALTSISIPNSVTNLGVWAFEYCTSLKTAILGAGITEIGDYTFSRCHNLTSVNIPDRVTSIGESAFSGCWNLISITIPNSVKKIGGWAFINDSKLTTVVLGNGITEIAEGTFRNCNTLPSIIIPEGVTFIGNQAFSECHSLTSIKLPESFTSVGEGVFDGCPLKSIELPDAFTVIPDNLFKSSDFQYIKLGNNIKSIGHNAFGSCLPLIEITTPTPPTIASDAFANTIYLSDLNVIVPDAAAETAYRKAAVWQEMTFANLNNNAEVTVDTPGDLSFELLTECNMQPAKVVNLKVNGTINADDFSQILVNMKSLLRLDLSDCNITAIPDNSLNGKTQLQELTLPKSLQTIGNNAFYDCPYLTGELNLPSTVTAIGTSAFMGTGYTSVKLPSALKTIGDNAFYNLPIKQSLVLPSKVTSVGASAFAGTKIESLSIPSSVTTIGNRAFAYTQIKSLTIKEGVKSIGDEAFAGTPIEDHVTIPDGVTYLGTGAFKNSALSTVFLPNSVTTLGERLFQGCPNLDLVYVPDNYTAMSNYAFDGCGAMTTLRLSANTASMGEYSMQGTPLEYVKVPSQVEVLPRGMLKNCRNLESLSLPANLKSVEEEALDGCIALRNMSVEATTPPVIKDKSAIRGINTDKCLISIPTSAFRQYVLAEYWGQFVQMRNDIAVETEGNGEIGFESVEDEEDEEVQARAYALRSVAARASRRGQQLAAEEESMTIANNGSSVYVPQQGKVRFYIIPAEGESILSATLDGEDIMPYIVDGVYTATADKRNAKLVVVFSTGGQGSAGLQGDVNGDGEVSVTDVGCVINYILEQVPDPFIFAAADMNGDEEISVTDVGFIINYILNDGATSRSDYMATCNYGEPMLMPNTSGYVLTLNGAEAFIGFQMDVNVTDDVKGCSVRLKETGTDHQMVCRQLSDGHYRVVCYSPTNETFPQGITELLAFDSESEMTVSNIRFTTAGLEEVRFADMGATPTGIASVSGNKATDIKVYTLSGQLYRTLHARPGENPLKDLKPGIYLINEHKYIVK